MTYLPHTNHLTISNIYMDMQNLTTLEKPEKWKTRSLTGCDGLCSIQLSVLLSFQEISYQTEWGSLPTLVKVAKDGAHRP